MFAVQRGGISNILGMLTLVITTDTVIQLCINKSLCSVILALLENLISVLFTNF